MAITANYRFIQILNYDLHQSEVMQVSFSKSVAEFFLSLSHFEEDREMYCPLLMLMKVFSCFKGPSRKARTCRGPWQKWKIGKMMKMHFLMNKESYTCRVRYERHQNNFEFKHLCCCDPLSKKVA